MKYNFIAFLGFILTGSLPLIMPTGVFAQSGVSTSSFNLGQAVKTCNVSARDDRKEVEMEYKNKSISKEDRKNQLSEISTTRFSCINEAKTQAKQERQARLEEARKKRVELKKAVLQCNQNKTQEVQSIRQEYRNHDITRQEMNSQLRTLEQTRRSCVNQAREEIYNSS